MEMLASPGLWVGLLIGFPAGMAFQQARVLMRAYRETRDKLPAQKEVAAKAETRGALWVLVVVGLALLVLVTFLRTA